MAWVCIRYRKVWKCHLSNYGKTQASERNTDCTPKMDIVIKKLSPETIEIHNPPLRTIVSVDLIDNHTICSAAALKLQRVTEENLRTIKIAQCAPTTSLDSSDDESLCCSMDVLVPSSPPKTPSTPVQFPESIGIKKKKRTARMSFWGPQHYKRMCAPATPSAIERAFKRNLFPSPSARPHKKISACTFCKDCQQKDFSNCKFKM